jgi:membrane protein implicated in regulation of membrane protease activity
MDSRADRTIPELFSDVLAQLAKLIGNEFDLAKAEMAGKAGQAMRAVALIGAGAVVAIPGLVVLLFAAAAALMHAGLSDPAAYAIVGGAVVLLSLILIWLGISRMSADAMKPSVTLEQFQRDKAAAKEMMQ